MRGDPPRPRSVRHANPRSTPHARGSTQIHLFKNKFYVVYPACAGIHPVVRPIPAAKQGLPRMRGDPPDVNVVSFNTVMSTPHARGSTLKGSIPTLWGAVYPACAGIHRCRDCSAHSMVSLPRMRGDPPKSYSLLYFQFWSTPHARGSTLPQVVSSAIPAVYPACAGIHPPQIPCGSGRTGLPRMRGDPPPSAYRVSTYSLSTPHARGSTRLTMLSSFCTAVYPACAGIHHRKTA